MKHNHTKAAYVVHRRHTRVGRYRKIILKKIFFKLSHTLLSYYCTPCQPIKIYLKYGWHPQVNAIVNPNARLYVSWPPGHLGVDWCRRQTAFLVYCPALGHSGSCTQQRHNNLTLNDTNHCLLSTLHSCSYHPCTTVSLLTFNPLSC